MTFHPRQRASTWPMLWLAVGGFGCGGAAAPIDADQAFARIQVHEATIARRAARARACEPDEPCPAAAEACEAAESLCAIASELQDADALRRCELGRRRCSPDRGEPSSEGGT